MTSYAPCSVGLSFILVSIHEEKHKLKDTVSRKSHVRIHEWGCLCAHAYEIIAAYYPFLVLLEQRNITKKEVRKALIMELTEDTGVAVSMLIPLSDMVHIALVALYIYIYM
jgi:hypothetical protein